MLISPYETIIKYDRLASRTYASTTVVSSWARVEHNHQRIKRCAKNTGGGCLVFGAQRGFFLTAAVDMPPVAAYRIEVDETRLFWCALL